MFDTDNLESAIEALVIASPEPLPATKIAALSDDVTPSRVKTAVAALNERYASIGASFRIREIAGGYQFYVIQEFVGYVEELFARRRKMRLTRAALETLSICAYKQPVTRAEIEQIRGVAADGVVNSLLEKGMIRIVGRADTVGRPLQYGTTDEFLKFFGLNKVTDLPRMSEIEELIADQESKNQTELGLSEPPEEAAGEPKLNIADGTATPNLNEDYADTSEARATAPSSPDGHDSVPDDADAQSPESDTVTVAESRSLDELTPADLSETSDAESNEPVERA